MFTLEKMMDGVRQVFGPDSYKVRVVMTGAYFKVEPKEMIHDGVRIRNESEMMDKLNDLYYDIACENFSWE